MDVFRGSPMFLQRPGANLYGHRQADSALHNHPLYCHVPIVKHFLNFSACHTTLQLLYNPCNRTPCVGNSSVLIASEKRHMERPSQQPANAATIRSVSEVVNMVWLLNPILGNGSSYFLLTYLWDGHPPLHSLAAV